MLLLFTMVTLVLFYIFNTLLDFSYICRELCHTLLILEENLPNYQKAQQFQTFPTNIVGLFCKFGQLACIACLIACIRQNDNLLNLLTVKDIKNTTASFHISDNCRRTLQFTSADFMVLLLTQMLELQLEREMKGYFGLLL